MIKSLVQIFLVFGNYPRREEVSIAYNTDTDCLTIRDGYLLANFYNNLSFLGILGVWICSRWSAIIIDLIILPSLGSGNYKRSSGSFLFSLVNPSGLVPTKMPLIAGREGYAIYCNSGYGPTFGGGHDLHIFNAPNTINNSCARLNNTYQCPTGQNTNTFLTGYQNFVVNELEVFGFDK